VQRARRTVTCAWTAPPRHGSVRASPRQETTMRMQHAITARRARPRVRARHSTAAEQLTLIELDAIRMDDDTICHHLEQLAEHLQVTVRYEPSAGKAGYCLLNGEHTIFIDQRMTLKQRAAALARMLCRFECEDVFLPPVVRSMIEESKVLGDGN